MCPKRNPTDAHRRRPSPSSMTIDELNGSELVALLNPAEASPTDNTGDSWTQNLLSTSLSTTFMVITFVITTLFAFSIGCTARLFILSSHGQMAPLESEVQVQELHVNKLPAPTIIPGKEVPYTTYTSKHFQMPGSATSNTLHIDRTNAIQKEGASYALPMDGVDGSELREPSMNEHGHNTDESGEHLPAGQHLLLDFKDVDSDFLNSEERLAKAMIELTNESGLTLLSYHCHALVPIGVSCAGVLLESHVAFHTWPLEGVIAMDLFTCGGGLLIPLLPLVKRLFAIPQVPKLGQGQQDIPEPSMLWSHKWRGFRHGYDPDMEDEDDKTHQYQCLDRWVLGRLDFDIKEPVVSTRTKFQAYDVYDILQPDRRDLASYHKSLEDEDSYESRNPELFAPDRVLFLDGVSQSTRYGDASYHESIVHPALIAHSHPERVAIVGGGEGATMREVLKHKTVKKAVMIEIDDEIVGLSKEYLPGWNDCSNIEGSAAWCFDDERAEARYEDAMAFFVDRYYDQASTEAKFDVIIMDALDPNDGVEFATYLYTDDAYMHSLYNGLAESGILVVQVGEIPTSSSPPDEIGAFKNRALMMRQLEEIGFKSIHLYDEGHSEFHAPWATMVAFKDEETVKNWYRNSAEVDLEIQKRIRRSTTDAPLLRNFDGSTMLTYQITPKVFQSQYCKQYKSKSTAETVPAECLDKKSFGSNRVYSPVLDRSAAPRQSRLQNFVGTAGDKARSSNADADNETHSNQVPLKSAHEKFMDGAQILFKGSERLPTCESDSATCE